MTEHVAREDSTAEQKLALLDELRQAERRAVSSRVASVLAHLIGTPLHVIAGRASLIRSAPDDATVAENARRIEEQVDKLARRIRALIDYLTAPDATPVEEAATDVISAALSLYGPVAKERGVELRAVGDSPAAAIDGTSALVVLTSLMSLATRVAPSGASCTLAVSALTDRALTFELRVPGFKPPRARLDTLEPPDQPQAASIEELQVLSVCAAIARRGGGTIEVSDGDGAARLRYTTARLA